MLTLRFKEQGRTPLEQLINTAKSNKLYDQEVLDTLATSDEKLKYLQMLSTANSLALDTRMEADGYSYTDIYDKQLKYYALENEYELALQEKLNADAQYQQMAADNYSKQLNTQFAEDARISGNNAIKTVVDTKYSGDYSAFMSEYKDEQTFFGDEYLAYADSYDETETAETLKYMQDSANALKLSQDMTAQLLARKTQLLENIAADRKNYIERTAYENASWVTKAGSSMIQLLAAPATEIGNVVEGLMDTVLTLASGAVALFGGEETSDTLLDWVAKDTIPLDTVLSEVLPYSYITSPYAKDNPLKWLYEIETSIIDMAPMALNLVAPYLGTLMYYASSAGRTAENYANEYSDAGIGQIIAYTTASTAIEVLTEKLNTDVIFGKGILDNWIKTASSNPVFNFVKEAIGEGIEEVASEIGSQLTASILRGENKFDGTQILRAGALGAATSVFLQGGNIANNRRRLLGINTKLTNPLTGMSLNLNTHDSAIVEDFLNRSQTKLDAGEKLSKYNQQIYDTLKSFDIGRYTDGKYLRLALSKIEVGADTSSSFEYSAQTGYTFDTEDTREGKYVIPKTRDISYEASQYTDRTETTFEIESRGDRNIISQYKTLQRWESKVNGTKYNASTGMFDATEWQSRIENLVNTVNEGASDETIDKLAQEFISDSLTESVTQELHQMAGAWTNSLLAADENSQAVLNAVNNYYNNSLQNITDRLSFTPHKSQAQASKLSTAFGANITLTTDTDKNGLRSQLLTATKRAYPSYTFNTFVSDSDTTPVVTVIGKNIYVDHRYLRSTNITSVVKQIETQVLTENFYWSLNQNAVDMLVDVRKRMYGLMLMRPERQVQIEKQIVYSALFVPGNELSVSLSELDHEAYTKLRTELMTRAKEQNVAVKNVAYRGMRVYDLTILKRLSADEAISKNLLTNNYSIDDLMNELGPDVERYTFKYGIDASKAGVRVLSAIRHLSDMFGFETDIDNFYQALSDIKNPDKYKNFTAFEPILKRYQGFSYDQAINLYLRDQFDFEIDPRGTILATTNIESILDESKVAAAYKLGKPIALAELLTTEGQGILPTTDCVIAFIDDLRSSNTVAEGTSQTSIRGKGLIQLNKNTKIDRQYLTCAHEIQHYLTWHSHQPFGATQLFRKNLVNAVYNTLPKSEQVPFLRSMVQFISESLADTATSKQRYEDILKFPDEIFLSSVLDANGNISTDIRNKVQSAIYWRYDVDEQQSNFRITRTPIDATGAYFQNTGIGPIVLSMSTDLSDSAYNFLKYFNNKSVLVQTADVDALLNQVTDGTATFDAILSADTGVIVETTESLTFEASEDIYAKLEKVLSLRGVRPTVKQLCQPMFWANNCIDVNLKAKYAAYTPTDCKRAVARITGLTFDNFQGKFVKPTELYQPKEYIKYIDDTALVLNRDDNVVIQLPSDYTPGKYISLDAELDKLTDEQTDSAVYYVDDRVFTNLREVMVFTDKSYISASQAMNKPDNPLLAVFDQFIDNMQQVGFTHSADFVLVTHDGKIVSYDSKGNPAETLKMFAEKLKLPWKYLSHGLQIDPTTGKYVGTLESGIMKQLLDAKKVMRAYRKGNTWEAFGKPNYVQDLMLRQMNATNASVSYLQPGDGTYEQYITGKYRLVVNKDGKVAIDRGNRAEYPEVSWKNNVWYGALMQIIEKYDIRTLSELKELGFNDDFIDGIRRNYGRAIQGKTSKKLGLGEDFVEASRKYSGLEQDIINQFINDESAHPFARNLLIQNAQARESTENLNWARCSHIRTVEDVDRYMSALMTYYGTLRRKNNNKRYATLNELIVAAKTEDISGDDTRSVLSMKKLADISYSNIVSLFLNIDSRQEAKSYRDTKTGEAVGTRLGTPEGLDFSLSGFQAALGNIMRGYAATMKSADDITGKTVSDETSGTGTSGRKSDDESNYSRIETSSEAIAKSILENAETKLGTQENLEYLRVYQRGITATMQYVNANKIDSANKALDKLRSIIENENAKVTVGEDNAWDPYLKQLYDGTIRLSKAIQRGETQTEATKQGGLDDVITEMRQRIEQAEDKRAAQDTEYQAATSNRARLIRQYGEKGYKRILDAVSAKAIFGDTTAQSNVKDNISKRLRANGSASIYARIDKYFDGPANTKLKERADDLKTFRDYFEGVIPGTEGYSEMRFRYSNLLTKFYDFVKAQTTSAQQAAKLWTEIKAERLEIAKYLDDLVLSGNYNFSRIAEPGIAMYVNAAEQLASGNITMDEFVAFKDASFETRIELLQALITTGLESDFPRQIIDRMQRILDDATITTDTTESLKKPRIDLSVLKLAQQRAGLSEDASSTLDSVITKVNEQYSDTRSAKAEASEQRQLLTEANNAAFNTKYMTWSYDRLSKEYRKYSNSPAITQAEAEDLIRHAALMIENFDYQTKSDAFMKRAKKAWKNENSKAYQRVKALIYYGAHGEWPKYYVPPVRGVDLNNPTVGGSNEPTADEIAMAIQTRKQYIDAKIESQIHDAASTRKPQRSAIQPEKLSEEDRQNRAEFIRQHIKNNLYEQLTRLSATESYNDTTKLYKESVERTIKRYLSDTNSSENIDYVLAQLGYPNKPLEDPVQIREINAILDLYIDRQRNNISHGTYLYERNRALSNVRNKSLDEFVETELASRKANLTAAADALWWNSYNKSHEYVKRPSDAEHTYVVPQIRRQTADQVKSVQELLKMYIEQNLQQTPSLDDLPETKRYYTTHKTLDDVLEDAATGMKIRNTDEDATLNNIINGISIAITEFQYRPMTLASAIKFINDVRTILVDKALNKMLFSWKNNVPTEKLKRFAFTEFTRNEAGERVAEETSIPSFKRMMKYLKSGQFTSHAQELDVELQEAAKQISDASDKMSNAVRTLLEEMKDVTVTEEDQDLESDLSRQMRQEQEAEWDEALDDAFNEIITDMTELLADDDFDFEFDDTPDEVLQGEPIQLEEFEDVVDFEDELKPKTKKPKKPKTDDRPLDEQFKPEDEAGRSSYKTTRSELLTRNGVDITKALEYQFKETTSIDIYGETIDRQRANTQEFITNPEVSNVLTQLLKNETAMKDFLVWLAEARSIDELTSLKALIILNKIEASPTISFEIRKEAQKIRKMKKSIAGAILGLGNRHGLTPVEEVNLLAMEMLKLTEDELAAMTVIRDKQNAAIDAKDFNAADAAMKEALAIFKKHQHELDVSINPFGKTEHSDELAEAKRRLSQASNDIERKEIQDTIDSLRNQVEAERAARWHNLTGKITTWRYFAMLSAPSTFFAKNVAGNYVAQGLNRTSEFFANAVEKLISKKRCFRYTLTNGRVRDAAIAAVNTQLVKNGILDGIMSNTVAKYQTGYAYRPSAIRNLTIDAVNNELGPDKYATINQLIRSDAPFGKMNEQGKTNIFAAGLNKMYSIIFGTMNKYDRKFMEADIKRLTEKLVSNNFSNEEIQALTDNTADEATLNKFYEIVEFARQEACKTYFRSQPKLYNDIMMLLNKYPMAQAIVSTIMPFPRMVINATMTALTYSPLGFIKMAMTLKTDKSMFANIRASQEFGKACTGTVAMVVGIILAAFGILDIDDEDPYTGPQLTIGDLRIALEGLEPSATPFIMGAMAVLGNKYDNTNVFAAGADALLESTVLGEMMSQFGNDDTGTKWIGSLFASYVTQFIPTVLRRTTQLIDPGKKNYTGNGKFLKRIAATIPFLSFAVEDKIDPYTGNAQVQYNDAGNAWVSRFLVLFNAISPTKISWNSDSAVEIESKAVDAATTGPAQTITKKGVDYKIPKKLYNQYKILRAQLYSQYASELIKTEAYKKLSNEKKAQKLKALQTRATNEARKQLNINSELNIP